MIAHAMIDSIQEALVTSRIIPVSPFDYVVFGATGDLARRKLLPALYRRFVDGQFDGRSRIIGVSRTDHDDESFRKLAAEALGRHGEVPGATPESLAEFLSMLSYVVSDTSDPEGWTRLDVALGDNVDARTRAYYLAVGPNLFAPICDGLAQGNRGQGDARLIIEKPIGKDLNSAEVINNAVACAFKEQQIYRIDHYLGKETVQNLMALRFANALFEPLWNAGHIDHIQITAAESLGAGDRAGYYNKSGALRDMIQNHLLQLLCLVAMEPPASTNADAVRDEKLKVLRSLVPITQANADKLTVRGQYSGIASESVSLPGYLDELGRASQTETFVAIKAGVENWRWAGVPFYLRTGKRMARRVSEIVIQFKSIPHSIFGGEAGQIGANRLILRLQPDEAVKLFVMIKDPGPGGMRLRHVPLNLSFAEAFSDAAPDAYERLLMDVIRGDQTLFMRRDEVAAAWSWIDPVRAAWAAGGEAPQSYTAGTWGPSGSVALIERDGRTWYEENH